MGSLFVIFAALLAFSGAGLWVVSLVVAKRRRERAIRAGAVLYSCLFLHVLASAALLAAAQLRDVIALLAGHPAAARAFLDFAVGLGTAARCGALFALARLVRSARPAARRPAARALPWAIGGLYAAYYAAGLPFLRAGAWETILAFLLTAALWEPAFGYLRLPPVPGRAAAEARAAARAAVYVFLPAKALAIVLDAAVAGGIAPLAYVLPDLGFFVFLNLRAYRLIAGMAAENSGRRDGEDGARETIGGLGLSVRESAVAGRLAAGKTYKEIARELAISVDTVKSHAKAVYRKSGCSRRAELMRRFGAAG
jgi:DNA-binding CsgD family transcriptional regulator